jgi:uncharacterized membrane protein YkvA (DUF1232 family)
MVYIIWPMTILERLRTTATTVRREVAVHRRVLQDPRTPRAAKWLLGLAIAYAVSPIDLIPDFIPIAGHVDDLIVLPALMLLALKLVPQEVVRDCRNQMRTF